MDDGIQVSKYLFDPVYLRELYLYELATTIELMRDESSTGRQSALAWPPDYVIYDQNA